MIHSSQCQSVQALTRKVTLRFPISNAPSVRGEGENFHSAHVATHSSGFGPSGCGFTEPDSWTDLPRPNRGFKDQFLHRTVIPGDLHAKGARRILVSAMR
jgi:hypothetical protein